MHKLYPQDLVGKTTPQGWAVGVWNISILGLFRTLGVEIKASGGQGALLKKARGDSLSQVWAPSTNLPHPGGGAGPPTAVLDCFAVTGAQGLSPRPLVSTGL